MAKQDMFILLLVVVLLLQVVSGSRLPGFHGVNKPLRLDVPWNVAHRGASGEIPEGTVFAYKKAIDEGAAFLHTDVTATKDGALICFGELTLNAITNVADISEFKHRISTYMVGDALVTGYFAVDFNLSEIKQLRLEQRSKHSDHEYNGQFGIITFDEYLAIALDAPRTVGVLPEIKYPDFINGMVKWGDKLRFEDVFLKTLTRFGYKGKYKSKEWLQQPAIIPSFASASLEYLAQKTELPQLLLIDTNWPSSEKMTTDAYLDYISKIVIGIGPGKDAIIPASGIATDLVAKAHARGLMVLAWTFDNAELHRKYGLDPYEEYKLFVEGAGVDALLTNFPATLENYLVHWGLKN